MDGSGVVAHCYPRVRTQLQQLVYCSWLLLHERVLQRCVACTSNHVVSIRASAGPGQAAGCILTLLIDLVDVEAPVHNKVVAYVQLTAQRRHVQCIPAMALFHNSQVFSWKALFCQTEVFQRTISRCLQEALRGLPGLHGPAGSAWR